MPKPMFATEQLAYSTARIECDTAVGVSTGTGFFYQMLKTEQTHVPVFVTNKHVVAGAIRGRFWLTRKDAAGQPVAGSHQMVEIDNFQSLWTNHPDPDVDLCALPIGEILNQSARSGFHFFYVALDETLLPTVADLDELQALDDIVMIGYPNGIWDSTNNQPIFRRGVTATHPNVDYEGRKEFSIDAACFPGSSGSPVLLFNSQGWMTRAGGTVMGSQRIRLLGILYAGPQHTTEGDVVVVTVPTHQKPVALMTIPNNLGYVIKASRIKEVEAEIAKRIHVA